MRGVLSEKYRGIKNNCTVGLLSTAVYHPAQLMRLFSSIRPYVTEENVHLVNDLVPSQQDTPQTHGMVPEVSRETGIRLRCHKITTVSLVAAFY